MPWLDGESEYHDLCYEPSSVLAPFAREQMQDHRRTLHWHCGSKMVFITHHIDEALALADRIIVLDRSPGRVLAYFIRVWPGRRRVIGRLLHLAAASDIAVLRGRR